MVQPTDFSQPVLRGLHVRPPNNDGGLALKLGTGYLTLEHPRRRAREEQ